ncbi:proline/glycine betaine ABC transporter permease [Aurantimonas sp. VKM B-3413]|uniref:ABC transporter permease n=1 Tax=Aurantimonas sp. VKM B-3413 TaxID=2779401 RepID=UPI001E297993|nr:proline/glycine betaine ABC transporter permease [Aurantimonas sp. VKM B-3413]MCB8838837.1 proline/glycine betaine ABC transporter permease [Aurantimonas sp. VKM B-3413]
MFSPSDYVHIPFDDWVQSFVRGFLVPNFRPFFRAAQEPVHIVMNNLDWLLNTVPMLLITAIFAFIAWRAASRGVAIFTVLAFFFVDMIGLWSDMMTTLSMIVTSVVFCVIIGVPVGIAAAGSDRFLAVIRPVLDVMQTIPSFVYLVPIVMLFGVGMVPGVIATIIFALPPIIRLTNLGIRNVRGDLIEAANSFGATRSQTLWEVQLPLALRTIMAGLNQTLMLALSMSVIAALIGAGGLGLVVNTGLGRLDVGTATAGGVGIVLLAIVLDRITQGLGEKKPIGARTSVRETLGKLFRPMAVGSRRAEPAE